jgi:hypothetical protein
MKKLEIATIVTALVGAAFLFLNYPGGHFLLALGLTILGCHYFYLSFALLNDIKLRKLFKKSSYKIGTSSIVLAIVTGMCLSILVMGLMFKLLGYPGADLLLMVGLPFTIVITAVAMFYRKKLEKAFYANTLKRGFIISSLALIALFTPYKVWVGIQYPNNPEYAKVLLELHENPDDVELLLEEERLREEMTENY